MSQLQLYKGLNSEYGEKKDKIANGGLVITKKENNSSVGNLYINDGGTHVQLSSDEAIVNVTMSEEDNKLIVSKINGESNVVLTVDDTLLNNSSNPVENKAIYTKFALQDKDIEDNVKTPLNTLIGNDNGLSVRDISINVLTEQLVSDTAQESFDTLQEIADWIQKHPQDAAAMNTAIQNNADEIDDIQLDIMRLDVQSDWELDNDQSHAYIQNKPPIEKGIGENADTALQQKLNRVVFTVANPLINESTDVVKVTDEAGNVSIQSGAIGAYSSIFGGSAQAKGKRSVAFGSNTVALGGYSHAEGNETFTEGANAHAEGLLTSAIGVASHSEGQGTVAEGENSHAEGLNSNAGGYGAHAEGGDTNAKGFYSHSEGAHTIASGESSHAEGYNTVAEGESSHAEGYNTVAEGKSSHAEGYETVSEGNYSHAEGKSTKAIGYVSHAEGCNTVAEGESSHAEGDYTIASGKSSHAEGDYTIASGESSHAEGKSTKAIGYVSHAEGIMTKTTGLASHAEGYETVSEGNHSHAEGKSTKAIGYVSHAEGELTEAKGSYSHAEGNSTFAEGDLSHAEGEGTKATGNRQHVQGKFNVKDTAHKYADIVGGGTSETDRKNIHTLDWQGNAWYQGSVTSNGADYAEFFEWLDGNPDNEDRVGLLVSLDGDKIKLANTGDEILGIISGTAAVLGDNYECEWNGKYLTDDFGRVIYDLVEEFIDEEHIEFKEVEKEVIDEETNETRIEIELEEVKTTEKKSLGFWKHPRLNPDYDPEQKYINRSDRPEWDTVGMLGKLYVRDDGTCEVNGYATVGENGIATKSDEKTNMRVLSRVNENIVRVLLK